MKMIFIIASLIMSLSALAAEKNHVACNVGIEGERYVELEMNFSQERVDSYVIIDGMKLPLPEVTLEIENGLFIVTNTVAQDDVQKITIPLPIDIFSEEESNFWILPAMADDKDTYAACIAF